VPRSLAAVALLAVAFVLVAPAPQAAAAGCDTPGVPTTSVYLPNITRTLGGPAGWQTPFIVQNVGTAATTLEVSFYRFSDGSLVVCRKITGLAPGTSFADVPNNDTDLPGDAQFSVVARSFGAQVVSVVNQHQGVGERAEALSYVGLSAGATRVALPYVVKSVGGWLTTMIIQNLGTATANVTASFTSADGTRTATLTRTIGSARSQFIDPTVESALLAGVEYAALLASDQPIAAVVNAHNDAPSAVRPMGFSYNGVPVPASPADSYLPYAARNTDGVARGTRLVVQNAGSAPATPTLVFRRVGTPSQLATVTAPTPIAAGRSWSFDLRFAADGTTACLATGSATCAGEGEHTVVASGGTFALLGITLSPATALGSVGSSSTGVRAYLPNVTRTLGGANGWTTPIVIQSAGASSVALRWYRFADGSLVTTQTLSGLSLGAGVRVDPRAVAGLADDTQYAVVADAQAPFSALVVELASGGDNAMVYEGFAATVSTVPVATTITVAPAAVTLQSAQAFTFAATVKDQFGNTMAGQTVTWSVVPATLGTITAAGAFTAGTTAVSGTIAATVGTALGTAAVTVLVGTSVTTGGFTFVHTATGFADVYVHSAISTADGQTLVAHVDGDVVQVQTSYGRSFATRPSVYVFATTAAYTGGLETVLGLTREDAAFSGANTAGLYRSASSAPGGGKIAMNWEALRDDFPRQNTSRHELTHRMIDQVARPAGDSIPAWLNEGSAELEERTVAGWGWASARDRYRTVTRAAAGTAFTVAQLTLQADWNRRTGDDQRLQYAQAAETALLLRADLGTAGVIRILELMGQGTLFEAAYQTVAARPFSTFSSTANARLAALERLPGISTLVGADQGASGSRLYYYVYGLAPNSTITIDIRGQSTGVSNTDRTKTADAFGVVMSYLDSRWPADTYSFTVTTSTGATLSLTAVKPATPPA